MAYTYYSYSWRILYRLPVYLVVAILTTPFFLLADGFKGLLGYYVQFWNEYVPDGEGQIHLYNVVSQQKVEDPKQVDKHIRSGS